MSACYLHDSLGFTSPHCNMREYIRRVKVDKDVKVFNTGDEFVMHVFRSHLLAAICTILNIKSPDEPICHERSMQWLEDKSTVIVHQTLCAPSQSADPIYSSHRSLLHLVFMYADLRQAIRWEDGPHIIRHWKWWLPRFLATGRKNYAKEAANLIINISSRFPKHISFITMHNRTVNVDGRKGHGKPIDQMMEHYNL